MKEMELSVQEIKELMEAFSRNKMGSLKLQRGDFLLKLEGQKIEHAAPAPMGRTPAPEPANDPSGGDVPAYNGNLVTSPIVGTFYAAPAPDKPPYVQTGSRVQKGDVLFIIESMKLMNEVTSELDGVVSEILVENAQGVEYGQPILVIE